MGGEGRVVGGHTEEACSTPIKLKLVAFFRTGFPSLVLV